MICLLRNKKLNKDCLLNIKEFLYYSKLEMEWFKYLHSQKLDSVNREISFLDMEYKTSCYLDAKREIKFFKNIMSLPQYFYYQINKKFYNDYDIILNLELRKYYDTIQFLP